MAEKKTAAKKPAAKKTAAKKPAAKKPAAKKPAAKKTTGKKAAAKKRVAVTHNDIELAAYYRAQSAGFSGDPIAHWLTAEAELKKTA